MTSRWLNVFVFGLPLVVFAQKATANELEQAALSRAEQLRPNFSGDWQFNAKASDDPREKLREAIQASLLAGGGGMGRAGMGRGGGGKGRGSGAGAPGAGGRGAVGGSVADLSTQLMPAQALHITHEDPLLLIADGNERPQRLFTDFRGGSVSANGGLEQRVSVAGWEGSALVVETTMLGKKLVQQYEIDRVRGQLIVMMQARVSTAPPVSYRLVYDPVKADASRQPTHANAGVADTEGKTE